ncbi:MAG: hypothetical protein GXP06_13935 [Alphaproteobacteria bacterium]|nr:hypothetical protein [Alphaproteobacteria bacterium]
MTSIVAIRCTDGVVVAADSSATFGDGNHIRTIEQPTDRKIEIIGDKIIIAGTGYVGHHQRFTEKIKQLWDANAFKNMDGLEFAKTLARAGLEEFSATHPHILEYAAFVAFDDMKSKTPVLCELPRGAMHPSVQMPPAFQPEIKDPKDHLWFASAGSGQPITDPFLALFREVFWKDGPPDLQGGKFTALWALKHACDVNPGGIKGPIKMAVLEPAKNGHMARKLNDDDQAELENMVSDATAHFAGFKDVLLGKEDAADVPKP